MGDHIIENRVRVHGPHGLEPMSSWDARIGKVIFDEVPLAEHVLYAEKEPTKRINVMLGVAYALMGAGVDDEICKIRQLTTRNALSTADFKATLVSDDVVRIETCSLTNEVERKFLSALGAIVRIVGGKLANYPAVIAHSPYVVRFYNRVLGPEDVQNVSRELNALLVEQGPHVLQSTSMKKIVPEYLVLHGLEAHWICLAGDDRTGVILDPLTHLLGKTRPRDLFPELFVKKAEKNLEYSDRGTVSVWLVMYVLSSLQMPYGDIDALIAQNPSRAPFDRLILGSKTIGAAF